MYVEDLKLAGKKQNLNPMWKRLTKEVDLGEPTSFLDHVYFGCTQRQCEVSQNIVDNYRTMFESRISAGREKIPFPQNLRISSWSYDMEVMQRNVWNDFVRWQTVLIRIVGEGVSECWCRAGVCCCAWPFGVKASVLLS